MKTKLKQKGFTLIEVVIVVAIIGMLSTIAIPSILRWLPGMHLKTAARDLYSSMQRTRIEAVKTNNDQAIVFDTANSTYLICSDRGADQNWATTGDNTVTATVDVSSYKSGVGFGHGSVPAGNSATSTPGAFPVGDISYATNVLIFNPQGIGTGGYVYLENEDDSAYAVGTQTSGVIMLKHWQGGAWQ